MKVAVHTLEVAPELGVASGAAGSCALNERIFGLSARSDIAARVVRWQLAARQAGTHASKGISDVSGTTRKPFRQKGTGRARQGSLRSPQFRGGGIIFGPRPRSHAFDLPKRVRRLGVCTALSAKLAENKLLVVDTCSWSGGDKKTAADAGKTRVLRTFLKPLAEQALFVSVDACDALFVRACRNWPRVKILPQKAINVYDLLRHAYVVIDRAALPMLEARLLGEKSSGVIQGDAAKTLTSGGEGPAAKEKVSVKAVATKAVSAGKMAGKAGASKKASHAPVKPKSSPKEKKGASQ